MKQDIRRFLKRRRFIATAGLRCALWRFAVGCSQSVESPEATAEEASEMAKAPAGEMQKVRVGFQTGGINNITMVAAKEGYFEKVGLDVEMSPYSSGGAMVPALAAGEVDITWFFPFPSLTAYATGVDMEVVLLDHAPMTAERLIASEGIADVAGLAGKTIGVTIGTSGHHSLLRN